MPSPTNNPPNSPLAFPLTQNLSPEIEFELIGVTGNVQTVKAMVDTGFTGFVLMPLSLGISANLYLWGTRPFILADGRSVNHLECFGKVKFAGKEMGGVITLSETSNSTLVGMQFLEELEMDFTVSTVNKTAIFQNPATIPTNLPSTTPPNPNQIQSS